MIRKLNFTGRKRIARSQVSITLNEAKNGVVSFECSMDLTACSLPLDADVYVEAYSRSELTRFHYGKIGALRRPDNRVLRGMERGALPLFRVKVVQKGFIVGVVDKIIPRRPGDGPLERISLLPAEYVDLGDLVWRVDFSNDFPLLQLNSAIEEIREMARSNRFFFSLVYPEVIRQVLRYILIEENYSDALCDTDDWQARWLAFAQEIPGVTPSPARDRHSSIQDREEWIDDVVNAFCGKWEIRKRFAEAVEEGGAR